MYLVRDIMYCKPGKVRAMVERFTAMSKVGQRAGMPAMRILTDVSAERYWTVVAEMEVPSLQSWEEMMNPTPGNADAIKEFERIMKDYHELVESGRREIYKIEA